MNEIDAVFDQKNIPLTLLEVRFMFEYKGVKKIICHHIEDFGFYSQIWFTKNNDCWRIPTSYIKSKTEIINPLP